MIICLGPCCIPVFWLLPIVLIVLRPLWNLLGEEVQLKIESWWDESLIKNFFMRWAPSSTSCSDGCGSWETGMKTGVPVAVASEEDFKKLESRVSKNVPVFFVYGAPWCKPCQALNPLIEELATELQGRAILCKVNVDQLESVRVARSIIAVPHVERVHADEPIKRLRGPKADALKKFVMEGFL